MIRKTLLFVILICIPFSGLVQEDESKYDLDSLLEKDDRPLVVFFTADWCKYCNAMKNDVFTNDSVRKMLSDEFHYVVINEKLKNQVKYKGQVYSFYPTGINTGYHEFTEAYAKIDGKLSYPTLIVLYDSKTLFEYSGYIEVEEVSKVLKMTINSIEKN